MIIKELFAKLGLDVEMEGFVKAQALVDVAKLGLEKIGEAAEWAGEQLKEIVLGTVEYADKIDETSQATGIAADALQELSYAASFSGMEMEAVAGSLTKLTRNMEAATSGGKEQAEVFAKLGVELDDGAGKMRGADAVLEDIAEKFKTMPDGAEKTALAMQVFGKSGAGMIPFLNAGRDGIEDLRKEAREFGLVMDDEFIKKGAEIDDTMTRLEAAVRGVKMAIGTELFGAVANVGERFLTWIRANREIIAMRMEKVFSVISSALNGLLFVLDQLWKLSGFVIDNWKFFATLLNSVIIAALIANFSAISAMATAYIAAGVAAVSAGLKASAAWVIANGPMILLVAAILLVILLIEDVAAALDGKKSILGTWLGKDWLETIRGWRDSFKEFWSWLVDNSASTWKAISKGWKRVFQDEDQAKEDARDDAIEADFTAPEDAINGFMNEQPGMTGEWHRTQFGQLRWFPKGSVSFGGGSSPEASASTSTSTSTATTQVVIESGAVTVNAAQGQSAAEVGQETFMQMNQAYLDSTAKAVTR